MLKLFWGRSLFSRVFLHGLVVLLASAATFAALGVLFVRPTLDRQLLELGRWMAPRLCSDLLAAEALRERVPHFVATAYSANGELKASWVTPALPPLSSQQVDRLRADNELALPGRQPLHAFWCRGVSGGAYVELGPPPPPPIPGLVLPFLLMVFVIALASVPFARSIARPIARLVRVAQALGQGKLAVRTEITLPQEVGELARAFNDMADRLQRLISAEQELLANVSHELRTPLARIRVVLESARENPPRAQLLLEEIGNDLGDLERLVETVMETMRLDRGAAALSGGQLPARLEPTDVASAMRGAVERFRQMYPERQVEFEAPMDPLYADADPRLLRHLLDNLLDNARKYSASASQIFLRVGETKEDERTLVRVDVTDQGVGIDTADLQHVFVPFFRSDRDSSRAVAGAGLGLALAKRIVDVHGGQISAHSKVGAGTTISFALTRSRLPSGCS